MDAEARGVLGTVRVYRDAFGRDNGGASRTENGKANEDNGRLMIQNWEKTGKMPTHNQIMTKMLSIRKAARLSLTESAE